MTQLDILVAGATGYVGRDVTRELTARGHRVTALVRPSSPALGDAVVDGALEGAARLPYDEDGLAKLARVDTVISCIASRTGVARDAWEVDYQRNLALLELAKRNGATRFILLSAICVQKPRLAFQFAKLKFETALAESGLDYAIIRPTAYFKSLAGQIGRLQDGKPYLMFGDGALTACKPISTADLARFIAEAVESEQAANTILPIGGPGDAITPREIGQMLFELANLAPKFRAVPPAMFRMASGLLTPLGWVIPPLQAKAELARIGHYYATESMLVWDAANERYDAAQTPSFGSDTLREFFAQALTGGLAGQELGAQRIFSKTSGEDV
ncbi:MAG: NAD(P)H-binding protein [Gammaproteobacteria bacterium]